MIVRGIVIDEDQIYEIAKEHRITNPDWICGIINELEGKIPSFIEQAIEAFEDWVATEGNTRPGDRN